MILPLDHPEPFAATLGVMLYPGTGDADRRKAAAYASHYLGVPLQRAKSEGHQVPYETLEIVAMNGGERLDDLEKRWQEGNWIGDMTNIYFMLARSQPERASWENAIKLMEIMSAKTKIPGVRSSLRKAKSKFASVAHLWAAWNMRLEKGAKVARFDGDGYAGLQNFLFESEIIRDWGQTWKQDRANAKPPLPTDIWRVPDDWQRPDGPDWPEHWTNHDFALTQEMIEALKPSGRPKKQR